MHYHEDARQGEDDRRVKQRAEAAAKEDAAVKEAAGKEAAAELEILAPGTNRSRRRLGKDHVILALPWYVLRQSTCHSDKAYLRLSHYNIWGQRKQTMTLLSSN